MNEKLRVALESELSRFLASSDEPISLDKLGHLLGVAVPDYRKLADFSLRTWLQERPDHCSVVEDPDDNTYTLVVIPRKEGLAQKQVDRRRAAKADVEMVRSLPAQLLCAFCTPSDGPVFVTPTNPVKCHFGAPPTDGAFLPVGAEYRCPHIHIHQNRRCDLTDAAELADSIRAWAAAYQLDLNTLSTSSNQHDDLFLLTTGHRVSLQQALSVAIEKAQSHLDSLMAIEHFHSLGARIPNSMLNKAIAKAEDYWSAKQVASLFNYYDTLPNRASFNALISKSHYFTEAIEIYSDMVDRGFEADEYTYTALLKACTNRTHVNQVIDTMLANEFTPTPLVIRLALKVPNEFKRRISLLQKMVEAGGKPMIDAFNVLLHRAPPDGIQRVLTMMEECGAMPDRNTLNILITKAPSFTVAFDLFEKAEADGIRAELDTFRALMQRSMTVDDEECVSRAMIARGFSLDSNQPDG